MPVSLAWFRVAWLVMGISTITCSSRDRVTPEHAQAAILSRVSVCHVD